jgi:glycosyltransferase involved in cell wall biosynthesis
MSEFNNASNRAPFFSVVTEVFNRKNTIESTIRSINAQSFQDYEYVIVDSKSTDGSVRLIRDLLEELKNERISFIECGREESEITRWNKPLKYISGHYVVVLEGDDWFDSDHLAIAHQKLSNYCVGIYVGQKNNTTIPTRTGIIKNIEIIKDFRLQNFCPPPSEAIFLRVINDVPCSYDAQNYVWAAEISLYEQILDAGYDIFIESEKKNNSIHRGASSRKYSIFHLKDALYFLEKNKKWLSKSEYDSVQRRIGCNAADFFAAQIFQLRFEFDLCRLLISNIWKYNNIKAFFIFLRYLVIMHPGSLAKKYLLRIKTNEK